MKNKNSGIRMPRANVGDKYVLEEMLKTGATLGGEQSGHIIFRDGDAKTNLTCEVGSYNLPLS